jgi:hypothetical protein
MPRNDSANPSLARQQRDESPVYQASCLCQELACVAGLSCPHPEVGIPAQFSKKIRSRTVRAGLPTALPEALGGYAAKTKPRKVGDVATGSIDLAARFEHQVRVERDRLDWLRRRAVRGVTAWQLQRLAASVLEANQEVDLRKIETAAIVCGAAALELELHGSLNDGATAHSRSTSFALARPLQGRAAVTEADNARHCRPHRRSSSGRAGIRRRRSRAGFRGRRRGDRRAGAGLRARCGSCG